MIHEIKSYYAHVQFPKGSRAYDHDMKRGVTVIGYALDLNKAGMFQTVIQVEDEAGMQYCTETDNLESEYEVLSR